MNNLKSQPFINVEPGKIIKREMDALNWTQKNLSEITNLPVELINQLIENKQSITTEIAIRLAKAFNSSPEFWTNLERNYRKRMKG